MSYHEVRADTEKNRLYIKTTGFLTDEDLKAAINENLKEADKLKPGFDVISDITELSVTSQKGSEEFTRARKELRKKGIGRNIIIAGESLARMQVVRKAAEVDIRDEYASSIEEAERMLDNRK